MLSSNLNNMEARYELEFISGAHHLHPHRILDQLQASG